MFCPKRTPEELERDRRWRERHPESAFNPDPVLISLIRRSMPELMNYQICNVQLMSGPLSKTGHSMVFTMGKPDYRKRIIANILKMKALGRSWELQNINEPSVYDTPGGYRRELNISKQVNSIEFVRNDDRI